MESFKSTLDEPLLVVVRRQKSVLSWQVPLPLEDRSVHLFFMIISSNLRFFDFFRYFYNMVSRTLCPPGILQSPFPQNDSLTQLINSSQVNESFRFDPIYVEFSTSSPEQVQFSLLATLVPDFLLQ